MTAADVAVYLDELALTGDNQLPATGRRVLRDAAEYLRFLHRQTGFESELPAYRRVLKAAVREWRQCGTSGRHSDYRAGRVAGLITAIAEMRDIEDSAAANLVQARLTRVDSQPNT